MKQRSLIASLSVMAAAAVLGTSAEASSNTLPALAGHAWFASEQGCFTSGWSSVRNGCAQIKKYLIPVPLTFTGNTKFYATGTFASGAPGASNSCFAIVNSRSNAYILATSTKSVGHTGAKVLLGTINVSSADYTAHYDCDMSASPFSYGLSSVEWTL